MIVFKLPLPPSVNHNKIKGRYATAYYNAWKSEAGWALQAQRITQLRLTYDEDVAVAVIFERRGDIDNRIKPLLDLLVEHQILADDKLVVDLRLSFGPIRGCEVTIEKLSPRNVR